MVQAYKRLQTAFRDITNLWAKQLSLLQAPSQRIWQERSRFRCCCKASSRLRCGLWIHAECWKSFILWYSKHIFCFVFNSTHNFWNMYFEHGSKIKDDLPKSGLSLTLFWPPPTPFWPLCLKGSCITYFSLQSDFRSSFVSFIAAWNQSQKVKLLSGRGSLQNCDHEIARWLKSESRILYTSSDSLELFNYLFC